MSDTTNILLVDGVLRNVGDQWEVENSDRTKRTKTLRICASCKGSFVTQKGGGGSSVCGKKLCVKERKNRIAASKHGEVDGHARRVYRIELRTLHYYILFLRSFPHI
jgi:hypothetical protein